MNNSIIIHTIGDIHDTLKETQHIIKLTPNNIPKTPREAFNQESRK